jgi:hypothetical protein
MKLFYLVYIALIFLFLSCKQASLLSYGVKQPHEETRESQISFLKTVNAGDQVNLIPAFESLSSIILSGMTPTSVYIFDKNENNIKLPGASNKCALEPTIFIESLKPSNNYSYVEDHNADSIYNWFHNTQADNPYTGKQDDFDFYVFITWAIWPGEKVFRRDIQPCINAAKNSRNAKMKVVLLNLDKQADWGKENLKKVKFTKQSMFVIY